MPNSKVPSIREYNKQVRLVGELRAALELEKGKSQKLRKRLKDERACQVLAQELIKIQCEKETQVRLNGIKREYEERIKEWQGLQDKSKRENEKLRLAAPTNAKIPGNLQKIEEHVYDKMFVRRVPGGTGGTI